VSENIIHIDFETRSACNLREAGVDVYSKHPTTEVLCVGIAVGQSPPQVIDPTEVDGWHYKYSFVAHNAAFEIAIWNNVCVPKYNWPPITPEQFQCTMVMAYAMGLPGNLDDASAAVGIEVGKDQEGKRIMMQLCKPKEIWPTTHQHPSRADPYVWWEEDEYPEKYEKLYKYCLQDVKVERELFHRLKPLSEAEQRVWVLDQKINERGVGIDVEAVKIAFEIVEMEKERLNNLMGEVTEGMVPTCTANTALLRWIRGFNIEINSVDKGTVASLLEKDIPRDVRLAIQLRQQAAKTSTAKLKTMLASVSDDGRIRGALQYHGASTGRWAGRKIQVQNFPRPSISQVEIDWVFSLLKNDE